MVLKWVVAAPVIGFQLDEQQVSRHHRGMAVGGGGDDEHWHWQLTKMDPRRSHSPSLLSAGGEQVVVCRVEQSRSLDDDVECG